MSPGKREVTLRFQVRWLLFFTASLALASLLLLWILKTSLNLSLSPDYSQAFHTIKSLQRLLLPAVGFSVLLYVVLLSLLVGVLATLVSHQIAGPVFRLERVAEGIGRGELHYPTRLRRNDQLHGLAESFAELQQHLSAPLKAAGPAMDRLEGVLAELETAAAGDQPQATQDLLARIEQELASIRAGLPN